METTRTYNRDSRLAFRQHTDYACAVTRPVRRLDRLLDVAVAVSIGLTLAVLLVKGISQ